MKHSAERISIKNLVNSEIPQPKLVPKPPQPQQINNIHPLELYQLMMITQMNQLQLNQRQFQLNQQQIQQQLRKLQPQQQIQVQVQKPQPQQQQQNKEPKIKRTSVREGRIGTVRIVKKKHDVIKATIFNPHRLSPKSKFLELVVRNAKCKNSHSLEDVFKLGKFQETDIGKFWDISEEKNVMETCMLKYHRQCLVCHEMMKKQKKVKK